MKKSPLWIRTLVGVSAAPAFLLNAIAVESGIRFENFVFDAAPARATVDIVVEVDSPQGNAVTVTVFDDDVMLASMDVSSADLPAQLTFSNLVFASGIHGLDVVFDDAAQPAVCSAVLSVVDVPFPAAVTTQQLTTNTSPGRCVADGLTLAEPAVSQNLVVVSAISDAPDLFPTGETVVTWTLTDEDGNTVTCPQFVVVVDEEPPVAECADDVLVATDPDTCSAAVALPPPVTDDNCNVATVESDAPEAFDVGDTLVTWTVTDTSGNTSLCTQRITVEDREGPVIDVATASPSQLWPPNHKMVTVVLAAEVMDNCDPSPVCRVISVASNEAEDAPGSGSTAPDWVIVSDLEVQLRAERAGGGNGRVYTVELECSDVAGNTTTTFIDVEVAHDQGGGNKNPPPQPVHPVTTWLMQIWAWLMQILQYLMSIGWGGLRG